MKFRPLDDRVLVDPEKNEEVLESGIIIPGTLNARPQEGKIIAIGEGKLDEDEKIVPLDVKIGDAVMFGQYAGVEIKHDNKKYILMRQDEILGIVNIGEKFKIVGCKVLVKPDKPLDFYDKESLIVRSEEYKQEGKLGYSIQGNIEQIGKECQVGIDKGTWKFKKDDSIVCQRYVGWEIKINGIDHRVVYPEHIEAIVEE